jgi:hypothetical protein
MSEAVVIGKVWLTILDAKYMNKVDIFFFIVSSSALAHPGGENTYSTRLINHQEVMGAEGGRTGQTPAAPVCFFVRHV